MTFDDYQKEAYKTAVYPEVCSDADYVQSKGVTGGLIYCGLGLAGEAGEVVEQIKKMLRDDGGVLTFERQQRMKKELGDQLWYVAMVAKEAGLSLNEVAVGNLDKLADRIERGTLQGDGSDR